MPVAVGTVRDADHHERRARCQLGPSPSGVVAEEAADNGHQRADGPELDDEGDEAERETPMSDARRSHAPSAADQHGARLKLRAGERVEPGGREQHMGRLEKERDVDRVAAAETSGHQPCGEQNRRYTPEPRRRDEGPGEPGAGSAEALRLQAARVGTVRV